MIEPDDLSKKDTTTGSTEGATDNTGDSTTSSTRDYEAEASKMGWRPEVEFKGPKDKFVDAQTFVENGERVLPIVRAENKALRVELDRVKDEQREFAKIVEKAHERETAELKAQLELAKNARKEAVTNSDGEAHEIADGEVKRLETELAAATPAKKPPQDPLDDPAFRAWVDAHPRYTQDEDFHVLMNGLAQHSKFKDLRGKGKALWDAVYTEAEAREKPSDGRERPGPARGGRGNDGVRSHTAQARSYDNLLPEFKQACDRMGKMYGKYDTDAATKKWRDTYVTGCTEDSFKG